MKRVIFSTLFLIVFAITTTRLIRFYNQKYHRGSSSSSSRLQLKHRPYQDIIINNKLIVRGHGPRCASRYNAIKSVLDKFKRPITVLDIGAASGYMAFRIAHDYPSTCVMVSDPSHEDISLKKLCKLNTSLDNVVLLSKRISAKELKLMSQREHFDVVLALNVLHHFPKKDWKEAAESILRLGDCIIIETPPVEDKRTCGQGNISGISEFIQKHDNTLIAKTRRHTSPNHFGKMYLIKGTKKVLNKLNLFDYSNIEYDIHCTFLNRFLVRRDANNSNMNAVPAKSLNRLMFPKGISLITFKMLNGAYPTKNMIKESIAKVIYSKGSVLLPENIIIQGRDIALFDDSTISNNGRPKDSLQFVYNVIDADDAGKVFSVCKRMADDCAIQKAITS